MADSIPSLRRKLAEAHARIAELEAIEQPEPVERFVERVVTVEVPVRVYPEAPPQIIVEVPVYIPPPDQAPVVEYIHVDNPALIRTIEELQAKLCPPSSL